MTENDVLKYLDGLGKYEVETREFDEEKLRVLSRGEKIFLVIHEGSDPLRLDVGVGKGLRKLLAEQYESVMNSRVMDDREWVEVICSGQLSDDEIIDLVRASWERAA